MGQPSTEPSMEDILASIKRIIAEDSEAAPPRGSQRVRRGPVAVPDPEPVEEAAREPEAADVVPMAFDAIEPPVEPEPIVAAEAPAPSPEPAAELPPVQEPADVLELTSPLPDDRDPILSGAAAQASRSAFAALGQLQVRQDTGQSNTLEGLVADLLKPMLRDYLDRELPGIVERLVAAEVKRVSGRG